MPRSSLSVGFHRFERPPTRPPLQMQGAIRPGGSGVVRRTRGKTVCEPGRTVAGLTNPVTTNAKASIARRCNWIERGHGVCFSPRQTDATRAAEDETPRKIAEIVWQLYVVCVRVGGWVGGWG